MKKRTGKILALLLSLTMVAGMSWQAVVQKRQTVQMCYTDRGSNQCRCSW